jgi:hypothetical protein
VSNDLLPALIAAGLRPADATRIDAAVRSLAAQGNSSPGQSNSVFSRPAGVGFQPVSGSRDTFALYASASGTYTREAGNQTTFGPGGGALGVDGVSVFGGDVYCSSLGSFESMAVRSDLAVAGACVARDITAGRTMQCGGSLAVTPQLVRASVPLTVDSSVSVAGGVRLDGDTTLNGRLAINGRVVWGGLARVPFDGLQVLTAAVANGGDTLSMTPTTVSVLNNFGQGRARDFKYELVPVVAPITDLIEFDPDTCTIVLKAGAPGVLVGGTIKITPT